MQMWSRTVPPFAAASSLRGVALAAALSLVACQAPTTDPELERELVPDRPIAAGTVLAEARPVDVFVTLPRDLTRRGDLPLEALRESLYLGLVERLYSPLALDWGDGVLGYGAPVELVQDGAADEAAGEAGGEPQEASAPAPPATPAEALDRLEADALLSVDLLEWDDSSLEVDGRVLVRLRVALQDPRREGSGVLWGWELSRWVELGVRRSRTETRPILWLEAVPLLSDEILTLLPERTGA
ncbi:MAG: hypothetical protein ACYS26_19595 [Planctomycetota bacterium]|jgi:hypothetical protein